MRRLACLILIPVPAPLAALDPARSPAELALSLAAAAALLVLVGYTAWRYTVDGPKDE